LTGFSCLTEKHCHTDSCEPAGTGITLSVFLMCHGCDPSVYSNLTSIDS